MEYKGRGRCCGISGGSVVLENRGNAFTVEYHGEVVVVEYLCEGVVVVDLG